MRTFASHGMRGGRFGATLGGATSVLFREVAVVHDVCEKHL
jgi:hypothetical protein